jgi:hypothetical protein
LKINDNIVLISQAPNSAIEKEKHLYAAAERLFVGMGKSLSIVSCNLDLEEAKNLITFARNERRSVHVYNRNKEIAEYVKQTALEERSIERDENGRVIN